MAAQGLGVTTHFFHLNTKTEDIECFYNSNADQYDEESKGGETCPSATVVVNTFVDVVGISNRNIKILDVGAGTGALGVLLVEHGLTNVDALDISQKMLDRAKEKKLYKNYICKAMTDKRLDIPSGTYDAIISCGAIACGLIKANAFDEILRLVTPGGYICFTLRKDSHDGEEYGYQKKFKELKNEGKWQEVRNFVTSYCKGRIVEFQKECHILCYKVLKNL